MNNKQSSSKTNTQGALNRSVTAAAAAGVLSGRLGSRDILKVTRLLNSSDPKIRQAAIQSLVHFGGQDTAAHVSRCLNDPNLKVRIEAYKALGLMRAHSFKGRLYDALSCSEVLVRCAAAEALAQMGDRYGLPCVARLVCVKGKHQLEALRTLSFITGHKFRPNKLGVAEAIRWVRLQKNLA